MKIGEKVMDMVKGLKCVTDPGMVELAEALKVLSDPNRLRIVCLLLRGEKCVCEVEKDLGISQQLASHHLNVLKEAGVLRARREGTSSYYAVVEEKLDGITRVFLRYLGYRERLDAEPGTACCAPSSPDMEGTKVGATGGGGAKR